MTYTNFAYKPNDSEAEKASNSYLMSVVAIIIGLPLPIVNLLATLMFFIINRNSTYFVRWHCTQALLSQFSMLLANSAAFWWTISIVFGKEQATSNYVAYIITVFIFNVIEFAATIYTAIQTRKGNHIQWWLYGNLTNLICRN